MTIEAHEGAEGAAFQRRADARVGIHLGQAGGPGGQRERHERQGDEGAALHGRLRSGTKELRSCHPDRPLAPGQGGVSGAA